MAKKSVGSQVSEILALLREAQGLLDELSDFDIAGAHLQQTIDDLDSYQSSHAPRA